MSETLISVLVIVIVFGVYHLIRMQEQLRYLELQIDVLLKHHGIAAGRYSEPSEDVRALAKDPKTRIKAIKLFRQQTGLSLKDAVAVIDALDAK